ncbi:MAG TPA: peptide chain release factor 2 [Gemmatimonadaceae bacterium]|nr:peptide chain release factor 2 [Gemmatimonadaceae bacterium]
MAETERARRLRRDAERLDELRGIFDLARKRETLSTLEAQMGEASFWDDHERAREIVQRVKGLKAIVERFDRLESRFRDALDLEEMLASEGDAQLEGELERETEALGAELQEFEMGALLRGPDDHRGALLEISSGAGGTESQDWASMLMRMYTRWAERKGFELDVLDLSEGEEAGIKGAMLEIRGENVYGFLRGETGVHRLVRISPFDQQARRHTSFASVYVYPLVDDEITIDIRDEDVKMDVFRASGAGGQHVNKTSSAVRLTHIPTGIVVSCQQERSQFKNRATAMKMLRAALYQREVAERERKRAELEANKADVTFGSQIRSYVFQPYTMVNDHRTELKIGDVQRVMDGGIDPFIEAFLKQEAASSEVA